MRSLSNMLSEETSRKSLIGFIQTLEEFHNYSVAVLDKPYEVHHQVLKQIYQQIIKNGTSFLALPFNSYAIVLVNPDCVVTCCIVS